MGLLDLAQSVSGGGVSVPLPQSTSTVYATALADSADGTVVVAMDGDAVTQPDAEEAVETLEASAFEEGQAELQAVPYPGTVTVLADGEELPADAFQVDGDVLTVHALSGAKAVEVSYAADVTAGLESSDFQQTESGDQAVLPSVPSGEVSLVREDAEGAVAIPVTVDGAEITAQGVAVAQDAFFEVAYERAVSLTADLDADGVCILPDEPESVTVTAITYGEGEPTETQTEDYTLDGCELTITAQADAFQVDYSMPVGIALNWSETFEQEVEDDEEEQEEHDAEVAQEKGKVPLDFPPAGEVSVTCDGEPYADFSIADMVLDLNWEPGEQKRYTVSYQTLVELDLSSSDFANGEYQLSLAPSGAVTVLVDGEAAENSVDEMMLSVPSLVESVQSYTVSYQAERQTQEVELPTAPSVREGEAVQVSIVNGTPIVTAVVGEGDRQDANIDIAYQTAADAGEIAQETKEIAEATNQHFWERSTAPDPDDHAGTGAFVTDVEKDEFLAQAALDFPDESDEHPYHNLLMNSFGILLRRAKKVLVSISKSAIAFYDGLWDGDGDGSSHIVARFGSDGAQIGKSAGMHVSIDADSLDIMEGADSIGYFGVDIHTKYVPVPESYHGDYINIAAIGDTIQVPGQPPIPIAYYPFKVKIPLPPASIPCELVSVITTSQGAPYVEVVDTDDPSLSIAYPCGAYTITEYDETTGVATVETDCDNIPPVSETCKYKGLYVRYILNYPSVKKQGLLQLGGDNTATAEFRTDAGGVSSISAYDNGEGSNTMFVEPGGNLTIGGGNAPRQVRLWGFHGATGSDGNAIVAADGTVFVVTNLEGQEDPVYPLPVPIVDYRTWEFRPDGTLYAPGNIDISKGSGNAYFTAERTDTGNKVQFGIGSGGTNRGIWDVDMDAWGINWNANGTAYLRSKAANGANVWMFSNTGDITCPRAQHGIGESLSSNDAGTAVIFPDKDGTVIGRIHSRILASDNRIGVETYTQRNVNGTNYYNALNLWIAPDGTRTVSVTEALPWRNALGATNGVWPPSTIPTLVIGSKTIGTLAIDRGGTGDTGTTTVTDASEIITAASGITIVSARYSTWGKVATLHVKWKRDSAIAAGAQVTVGTVVTGKRPTTQAAGGSAAIVAGIGTGGGIYARNATNAQFAANSEQDTSFTYLLP